MDINTIKVNDVIKVLVIEDDIEEEQYAIVKENKGEYLVINYYVETSKIYKSARLYILHESEELVVLDNISEHHDECIFEKYDEDHYYIKYEVYSDETSEVYDESETETETDLDEFIVSDDIVDGTVGKPSDHVMIDDEWRKWNPTQPGMMRFKETVDKIEEYALHHTDDLNF